MVLFSSIIVVLPRTEIESRAMAGSRLRSQRPAVAMHHALHGRQAHPGAREVALVVKALESAEQARGIGHVESGAVVGDEADLLAALLARADPDDSQVDLAGELPCIGEQVLQGDRDQLAVTANADAFLDLPSDLALGLAPAQCGGDLFGHR